MAKISLHQ